VINIFWNPWLSYLRRESEEWGSDTRHGGLPYWPLNGFIGALICDHREMIQDVRGEKNNVEAKREFYFS
jgi:lipid-A-disaccharide synthase-like uncharacterized protein